MITADQIQAARERSPEQALALALELWRSRRDPLSAELVFAFDAAARGERRWPKVDQPSWLAAARQADVVTVGWLADTLHERWPRGEQNPIARYRALRPLLPDPRLSRALLGVLADGRRRGRPGDERLPRLLATLAACEDPGAVEPLEALLASKLSATTWIRQHLIEELQPIVERLRTVPVHPGPDPASWRALLPAAAPPQAGGQREAEALLAQIRAEPENLPLRRVYADLLCERSEPRGEFVQRQLAEGRPPRELFDAGDQLLPTWPPLERGPLLESLLGPDLMATLIHCVFVEGFLFEAELRISSSAPTAVWKRAMADERLLTLHTLRKGHQAAARRYEEVVAAPACRNLRLVEAHSVGALDRLMALKGRRFAWLEMFKKPRRGQLAQLAEAPAFRELRGLRVMLPGKDDSMDFGFLYDQPPRPRVHPADRLNPLLDELEPLLAGLEVLSVQERRLPDHAGPSLAETWPRLAHLRRFSLMRGRACYDLSAHPEGGTVALVSPWTSTTDELIDALDQLPHGLREVSIHMRPWVSLKDDAHAAVDRWRASRGLAPLPAPTQPQA